jgi:hypothetical protein
MQTGNIIDLVLLILYVTSHERVIYTFVTDFTTMFKPHCVFAGHPPPRLLSDVRALRCLNRCPSRILTMRGLFFFNVPQSFLSLLVFELQLRSRVCVSIRRAGARKPTSLMAIVGAVAGRSGVTSEA